MPMCPNCQRFIITDFAETVKPHVLKQVDASTGQEFFPVNRIIGQEELIGDQFCDVSTLAPLWPEDYICFEPVAFVD